VRIYLDSSALIKRAVPESESAALATQLDAYHANGADLWTSVLGGIEVSRILQGKLPQLGYVQEHLPEAIDFALSGVAEQPITDQVAAYARWIGPSTLRSLDAIHVATAVLLHVDHVITYDHRMIQGCEEAGLAVSAPGAPPRPSPLKLAGGSGP
jgi:predicted nucleic acid-binding protein